MTGVHGDQEEFADLIGTEGELTLKATGGAVYMPADRGDWLTMVKTKTTSKGDEVTISTDLGNTFVFRVLTA